jgi:hypothetical protein
MRKSLQDKPADVRIALIGILLVFCFESLQGHQGAASAHASSGINLVMNLCKMCQPRPWKFSELGSSELYAAFSNLDLQSLLFLDKRPIAHHQFYKNGISAVIVSMPEKFPDLQECRRYWHYIMRRNLHFSLIVRDALQNFPLEELTQHLPSQKFRTLAAGDSPWIYHTPAETPLPIFLLAERDLYVKDICRWEIASAPLLCKLFNSPDKVEEFEKSEEFLIACLLRIHAAMNYILLTRAFNPPETEYDKFSTQFRTIVELSEKVHHLLVSGSEGEGEVGAMFRFEPGILPALSQVGLLCREKGVRGRAIALLRASRGYKEGIWDAEAVGAVDDWVRGVEEEGWVEGEGVPGNMRAVLVGCEKRLEERWARVHVRVGDGKGGWEDREEEVRW